VAKKCPECGSPYLVEKTLRSGIFLDCPNKKKGAEEEVAPKKTAKGKSAAAAGAVEARLCAAIRSGLAMRRLRRRLRRMGR